MAWTVFPTITDGQVLTGAHMAMIRDNFALTAPGLASAAGRWFISQGVSNVAERAIEAALVSTSETTTSTSFVNLATAGPTVELLTGTRAIVILTSRLQNSTSGQRAIVAFEVTGASSRSPAENESIMFEAAATNAAARASVFALITNLTAGTNTFQMKYRVTANTGTFEDRRLCVMGM